MKKHILFASFVAICASLFFMACQKEQISRLAAQTTNLNPERSIQNGTVKTDHFVSFPFPPPICMFLGTAINGHCDLPSGFCHYDWHDWRFPSGLNEAPGYGTVDGINNLTFDVDITNVDPAYLDCINNQGVFTVAQNYQIPDDILQSIYDNAGIPKPEGAFFVPAGNYPVEIQGDGGDGGCWKTHLISTFGAWVYTPGVGYFPTNINYQQAREACSGGTPN